MDPSNCGSEAHAHDHDHSHDHSHDKASATEYGDSLFPYIDTTKIRGLNIQNPANEFPVVFKSHDQRLNKTLYLDSTEDDPEMILHIPFTESVNIHSICISGGEDGHHPKNMKLFVNREDVDFSNAVELPAQQKLELAQDFQAEIFYPLQVRKFQAVSSLTIFFQDAYEEDVFTRVYYIGLKGESKHFRHGVVECVYEASPQLSDHKISQANTHGSII